MLWTWLHRSGAHPALFFLLQIDCEADITEEPCTEMALIGEAAGVLILSEICMWRGQQGEEASSAVSPPRVEVFYPLFLAVELRTKDADQGLLPPDGAALLAALCPQDVRPS